MSIRLKIYQKKRDVDISVWVEKYCTKMISILVFSPLEISLSEFSSYLILCIGSEEINMIIQLDSDCFLSFTTERRQGQLVVVLL